MGHEPTKLVLGRGEVYFDRFLPGTRIGEGERYLGNTSTFRIQRQVSTTERARSYGGRKVSIPDSIVSESHSVEFVTDNIDIDTIALWFGAAPLVPTVSTVTVTETFVVKRGRFYQLGKSQTVAGTRNVTNVVVRKGVVTVVPTGNYVLDSLLGRIQIERYALALRDGDTVSVSFNARSSDTAQALSAPQQVQGSLRFVSFNEGVVGRQVQNDYFLPFVTLSPRGQVDTKGDEWQQWGFTASAFNLSPNVQQLYVTRAAQVFITERDQTAIIDEMGDLNTFPYWDDQLQIATNIDWPPAVDFEGV